MFYEDESKWALLAEDMPADQGYEDLLSTRCRGAAATHCQRRG